MTDNVTPLPTHVDLDLDVYEKPQDQQREPYCVKVGGKVVSLTDPEDVDWEDLFTLADNPYELLRLCSSPEDRKHILDQKLPGHKFAKLMEGFQRHFGIEDRVADARRAQRRFS